MELNVCWMYHDIMDLYGDKGNMMVLQKRCEERGISITIDTLSIGDQRDLRVYDLLFLGGGADKEQMMLIDDLLSRRENIREAMEQGTFVLLICGGYQLFGQYYISADNEKIEGLKFFDYYTTTGSNGTRCIGNIAIRCNLDGNGSVLGTYMHGPLFPKNPEIVDFVIYKSLKKNHPDVQLEDLIQLDDTLEQKAKEAMLKRLQVQ